MLEIIRKSGKWEKIYKMLEILENARKSRKAKKSGEGWKIKTSKIMLKNL